MESNNIEEDENIDPETKEAKKELKELIEKNEELLNFHKKCEEDIKTLQKNNEIRRKKIKSINDMGIFDFTIDELKDYINTQNQANEIAEEKKKLQEDINNTYYKAQQASANYDQLEIYNSDIIKKIKEINEEKNKIEEKLKQTYEDTKHHCDVFKEEYKKKYDEISNEVIIKENEELKSRIKEVEENTNRIKEDVLEKIRLFLINYPLDKSINLGEELVNYLNRKLKELNPESDNYEEE